MCRRQTRVQREGAIDRLARQQVAFLGGKPTDVDLPIAHARQPDPGQGVRGIQLRGSFVVLRRHLRIAVGVPLKEVEALQVGIEGFRIDRVWPREFGVMRRAQADLDLLGEGPGNIFFESQYVFRLVIVVF